jgi:hypothetical protein
MAHDACLRCRWQWLRVLAKLPADLTWKDQENAYGAPKDGTGEQRNLGIAYVS